MTEKFHERFNIHVPVEEAKKRFVNRVHNEVLGRFLFNLPNGVRQPAEVTVLTLLGIKNRYDDAPPRRPPKFPHLWPPQTPPP